MHSICRETLLGRLNLVIAEKPTRTFGDACLAPHFAAQKLRQLILEREDGTLLGSQGELMQLLGIGRVTLKQVARLLEHENLLVVRRGINGGYYGARPNTETVERAVATYLHLRGSHFENTLDAGMMLAAEIARLAALSNKDESVRAEIEALIERFDPVPSLDEPAGILDLEQKVSDLLYKLAESPFVELMYRVHTRLFFDEKTEGLFRGSDDVLEWRNSRQQILKAVLADDAELAGALTRSFARFLRGVLRESRKPDLHDSASQA
jgi:GntR family transcriptional repressor for pyruvate dehydrogenase complex